MSEKRGRGQPKFEPTQDQRNQVKMMKALGIPEDRICTTITNPRTGVPVAPMTLAPAFAPELIHEAPVWIVPCLEGGTPTAHRGLRFILRFRTCCWRRERSASARH